MHRGVVISDTILLEALAYWKTGTRDPSNLKDFVDNKEEYSRELEKGSFHALNFLAQNTGIRYQVNNLNLVIHLLRSRVDHLYFVGGYTGDFFFTESIWRKLPGHLALISESFGILNLPDSELDKEIIPQVQECLDRWLRENKDKIDNSLALLGLNEFPIENYFAGEGSGPMSLNDPPLVIPEMKKIKSL
jgi:hypothetical protein